MEKRDTEEPDPNPSALLPEVKVEERKRGKLSSHRYVYPSVGPVNGDDESVIIIQLPGESSNDDYFLAICRRGDSDFKSFYP